jgi:hypothetical protein
VGLIAGVFAVAAGSAGEGNAGTEAVFGSVDEETGLDFGLLTMATVIVVAAPISATIIGTTIDFLSSATNSFLLLLRTHKDDIHKTRNESHSAGRQTRASQHRFESFAVD